MTPVFYSDKNIRGFFYAVNSELEKVSGLEPKKLSINIQKYLHYITYITYQSLHYFIKILLKMKYS